MLVNQSLLGSFSQTLHSGADQSLPGGRLARGTLAALRARAAGERSG